MVVTAHNVVSVMKILNFGLILRNWLQLELELKQLQKLKHVIFLL